ncbi:hypothetical protein JCM16303_002395 [Sporobolomyces ruberrimus]
MRLVDLPHELIQECAARLEPHDLATLVATSSYLHGVLLPTLYRSVTIRYALYTGRGQAEAEQLQMLSLRQTLRSIAASQERCRLIRKLELRNYGRWFGEEEAGWVETIVKHTRSLERVDLLQDDDGEPFDEALTPLANFKPVWIAFKTLPSLRVLHCSYGPNVRLGLEEFPSLVETSLSMYYVDSPLDGTLPPSLRSLSLDYVNGISHEWLRPSTFSHLESLALADLTVAQLQVISDVCCLGPDEGLDPPKGKPRPLPPRCRFAAVTNPSFRLLRAARLILDAAIDRNSLAAFDTAHVTHENSTTKVADDTAFYLLPASSAAVRHDSQLPSPSGVRRETRATGCALLVEALAGLRYVTIYFITAILPGSATTQPIGFSLTQPSSPPISQDLENPYCPVSTHSERSGWPRLSVSQEACGGGLDE